MGRDESGNRIELQFPTERDASQSAAGAELVKAERTLAGRPGANGADASGNADT
jgi:hypothetical protein